MFKNLTLSVKINILIVAFIIVNVAFLFVFLGGQSSLRDTAVDTTKSLIDSTEKVKIKIAILNMAATLEKDFETINKDSIEEVYHLFNKKLDDIRFEDDKSGYFFIYQGTKCILAPANKHLENTDLGSTTDPNGVRYIYEMSRKASLGGGYIYYQFMKPGKGVTDKVSYVSPIKGTGYWIGSGVYLDNIDNAQNIIESAIVDKSDRVLANVIIPVIILVLILILFSINIKRSIIKPISKIIENTDRVALGELNNVETVNNDELSLIAKSLNNLVNRLKKTSLFAKSIGEGDFDTDFATTSEKDILGISLLNMRESLRKARIDEEKRIEDEKVRIWVMNGHTIINDILRENQQNIDTLCEMLLQKIIEYIDMNQGGIFLKNSDDDNMLELVSSYAYDRKKYQEKNIQVGEGLVGTCAIERKTIFMTKVPSDYISIGSGLGDAKPRCLIIVPLIINEQFFGVIELASFKEIKDYEIKFIEKTAENIASTISVAQITANTAKLLDQHKEQAEMMSAQEEEMRQNMEELQATQEESSRREKDLLEKVALLEKTLSEKE
ncbi:MAG: cache domain-containing protein [Bacteroidales bacterium]|nr:cache domain-containing protein [Bacteroidales bacterium]